MSHIYPVRLFAGVALAAIGCGEAPAETRTSDPAVIAESSQSDAFDQATVERMLRAIFATYTDDEMGNGGEYYSADVEAMIEKIEYLDADPFCGCQDFVRMEVRSIRFAPGPDGRLDAAVTFVSSEAPRTFRMVKEPRGWRGDDILEPDGPSLRNYLKSMEGVAAH